MIHDSRARRVAVVGAGPAGIHALDALICMSEQDYYVDLFDAVPAPIGVIGFGSSHRLPAGASVATPRLRLFGNVRVGRDITVGELTGFYDTVVVAGEGESLVVVGTNQVSSDVIALLRGASDLTVSRTPVVARPTDADKPGAIIRLLRRRSVPYTSWSGWHRPAPNSGPDTLVPRHDVVTVAQWSQRVSAILADTVVP